MRKFAIAINCTELIFYFIMDKIIINYHQIVYNEVSLKGVPIDWVNKVLYNLKSITYALS